MKNKSRSWLALAAVVIPVLISVPLVFGFFGAVHPAFDSFAQFRLHLAVLMAVCALPALFLGLWREGLMAIAFAATALGSVFIHTGAAGAAAKAEENAGQNGGQNSGQNSGQDSGLAEYKLLQLNLRYDNSRHADVFRLIARVSPDVITLEEVSAEWRPKLAAIEGRYPYHFYCPNRSRIGGAAVLSRRPFALGSTPLCVDSLIALARVDFGGYSATIGALHLDWPWPFAQDWNVAEVRPYLEKLQGPLIIAGDFNAAPWTETLKNIMLASRTRHVDGLRPSWLVNGALARFAPWVGLPLDHVLVSDRIVEPRMETLEAVGSDHLPLLLRFSIAPGDADPGPDQQTVMLQR